MQFLIAKNLLTMTAEDEAFLEKMPVMLGEETASAERKRRQRERERMEINSAKDNVTALRDNVTPESRLSHVERDIDLEKEKDIDIDTEGESTNKRPSPQYIASLYQEICKSYPAVKRLSNARIRAIKARLNQGYTVNDFVTVFKKAENSTFLKGGNKRNWSATFDWMINDTNMTKILDGNYDDHAPAANSNGERSDFAMMEAWAAEAIKEREERERGGNAEAGESGEYDFP